MVQMSTIELFCTVANMSSRVSDPLFQSFYDFVKGGLQRLKNLWMNKKVKNPVNNYARVLIFMIVLLRRTLL